MNMSFPRDIRQVGILYVVDEVKSSSDGKSYRAYGKIQTPYPTDYLKTIKVNNG